MALIFKYRKREGQFPLHTWSIIRPNPPPCYYYRLRTKMLPLAPYKVASITSLSIPNLPFSSLNKNKTNTNPFSIWWKIARTREISELNNSNLLCQMWEESREFPFFFKKNFHLPISCKCSFICVPFNLMSKYLKYFN